MARKIIHDGPVNTAVMAWMRGQGIKPEDVRGYTLTYDAGNLMTIDIRMIMEDVAPVEETPAKVWPARVRDVEGKEFRHVGNGQYRRYFLPFGPTGDALYTLDEIGEHSVIEE